MEGFNLILAWTITLILFLLSIIYPLRKFCRKRKLNSKHPLRKLDRILRILHEPLGILVIALTFLHCKLSEQKLGVNLGTICLFLLIILFAQYIFRAKLKSSWLKHHRQTTLILWGVTFFHIIVDTERIQRIVMNNISITNLFWYFVAYAIVTAITMLRIPEDKRKRILKYTINGSRLEKLIAIVSLLSRYVLMGLSFFLPITKNVALFITGSLIYLIGLILTTLAMWQFSRADLEEPITNGLFRLSRNPMQVASFLMQIGIAIVSANLFFVLVVGINIISSFPMFYMQERYCSEQYGALYKSYMKKTPRIILYIGKQ